MPTVINVGELNQRVTFQRRAPGADAAGQPSGAWTDVCTVWAKVAPLRTRDLMAAGQAQRLTDHRVLVRYRSDIDSACRLVWRGAAMEIEGDLVAVDGGREWIEINAIKGVRDGL